MMRRALEVRIEGNLGGVRITVREPAQPIGGDRPLVDRQFDTLDEAVDAIPELLRNEKYSPPSELRDKTILRTPQMGGHW